MAAAWTPSSEAEGDLLVYAVGVLQRDSEEDQRSFCQAKAPPQKRRAVIRVESVETQDYVSPPALTRGMEPKSAQETQRSLRKFLILEENPRSIYTYNVEAREELNWNHERSTPRRSETNCIAERAVRRVEEGPSSVLVQESSWADVLLLSSKCARPTGRWPDTL